MASANPYPLRVYLHLRGFKPLDIQWFFQHCERHSAETTEAKRFEQHSPSFD